MERRWWALGAVALGSFMTYLDNNVVNVALPTIQREMGLTLSGLEWIASSYILVFAGLMLAGGRLADVFGSRRTFLTGLAVFTAASVAAGLAANGAMLIAARSVQGVGAALLTPTSLALLSRVFPDARERGTAVGIWTATGALSMALGPLTGGFISENWHWGWIFLINVPLGIGTLALGAWALPATRDRVRRSLDLPGLAAATIGLFALTFALIEGEREGWTSPPILTAFALVVVSATTFLLVERRSAEPMIDLSLFRSRVFSGGIVAMGLWSFGVFGIYFFSALWLQNVLGFTPTQAGAAFVPMALLMAVVAVLAQRVARLLGDGRTVALGLTLMAGAVFAISRLGAGAGYTDILPWFLVYALGGGLLVPLTSTILGTLPDRRAGVASGVINVSREVFGLLGITVMGAILTARQTSGLTEGLPALTAFLDGYRFTLAMAAVIVLAGVPISLYALRRRPSPTPKAADEEGPKEPAGVGSA
ncbi:DHA2 family efflux MFS transporter permease subunit [Spongiactinospora rosea]|uniref:DHA2 family efflux MFS transporter permease subunit n=1 Tax=Spongiactinospora rosea TaxID=2248750 RepID=UPI001CEC9299|nr:DHA2 family efflux MFS transporter permease subunit [Spongiactinospora rosea]